MPKTLLAMLVLLALAWAVLSLWGYGLLVRSEATGGQGDSALICHYLKATGFEAVPAYGLDPSCPPVLAP